ncbi:MAG: 2-phosphosulfolactate phosphatase [Methanosphaera sp. rholeuAM74]|nr:MAG: 2-phosphosulfolactate phosphatase [Methanosphaera sp. rholeuAM74]
MKIDLSLYNSSTSDLAIMIDLLRASTTIALALNTFEKIIPVNTIDEALQIKQKHNAVVAGEIKAEKIDCFDLSNSPKQVTQYAGPLLVLKTTNGTKVLENIRKNDQNIRILIGTSINAKAVAHKAIELAENEIELVMAGRHQKFTIEDYLGAGLIINEITNELDEKAIEYEVSEYALSASLLSKNHKQTQELIKKSYSARRLRELNSSQDIGVSIQINKTNIVPSYDNGQITNIN